MNDFAAIDFETANRYPSSVCSVGVVVVRSGVVVERFYSLIYPQPDYFQYWNTRVHGLRMRDVEDAPDFPQVWEQIAPLIEGLPLVAHNAPFDSGCLRAAFAEHRMDYPGYTFLCTCRAARRAHLPLPNAQLDTVAAYCGYDLKHHHHALADAEACAAIALKLL